MATMTARGNPNPTPNPHANQNHSRRRKRSPEAINSRRRLDQVRDRSAPAAAASSPPKKNLVMGQVKILKRGEPLTAFAPEDKMMPLEVSSDDRVAAREKIKKGDLHLALSLGCTKRLGPDPDIVQRQIHVRDLPRRFYAGPGLGVTSPPPSSLPMPCFLAKRGAMMSSLQRLNLA